jgi:hypothetical protein
VTGDPTKDGVVVKATKKRGNRLEIDGPADGGKTQPGKSTKTKEDQYNPRSMTRPRKTVKPRLNIGICGLPAPDGSGRIGPARCETDEPVEPPEPDEPTPSMAVRTRLPMPQDVTWEQVLNESKNVAFPGLPVNVQPAERTLVNLDTIVYTDRAKVSTKTVELLGFPVEVQATPMSYTWNFGDGTSVTTESPGKPYPAKEITHKYMKRGAVSVTLTTHYAARFNVAGTGWQYIAGTVPITGPATPLQVREAVPVLVDPPN